MVCNACRQQPGLHTIHQHRSSQTSNGVSLVGVAHQCRHPKLLRMVELWWGRVVTGILYAKPKTEDDGIAIPNQCSTFSHFIVLCVIILGNVLIDTYNSNVCTGKVRSRLPPEHRPLLSCVPIDSQPGTQKASTMLPSKHRPGGANASSIFPSSVIVSFYKYRATVVVDISTQHHQDVAEPRGGSAHQSTRERSKGCGVLLWHSERVFPCLEATDSPA